MCDGGFHAQLSSPQQRPLLLVLSPPAMGVEIRWVRMGECWTAGLCAVEQFSSTTYVQVSSHAWQSRPGFSANGHDFSFILALQAPTAECG